MSTESQQMVACFSSCFTAGLSGCILLNNGGGDILLQYMISEQFVHWDEGKVYEVLPQRWEAPTSVSPGQLVDLAARCDPDDSNALAEVVRVPHYARVVRYPGDIYALEVVKASTERPTDHNNAQFTLKGVEGSPPLPRLSGQIPQEIVVGNDGRSLKVSVASIAGSLVCRAEPINADSVSDAFRSRLTIATARKTVELVTRGTFQEGNGGQMAIKFKAGPDTAGAELMVWRDSQRGFIRVGFDAQGNPAWASYAPGELVYEQLAVSEFSRDLIGPTYTHKPPAIKLFGREGSGLLDLAASFRNCYSTRFWGDNDLIGALVFKHS